MAFTGPNQPQKPKKAQASPNPAVRPAESPKKVIPDPIRGGGGNQGGNRDGGGGNNPEPSPWLMGQSLKKIDPDPAASFVEYLRWMRSPDTKYKDITKVWAMQMAEESANYQARLETLNRRIEQIAGEGNWFEVVCPWRIRVGGHKGPESMLLPAFDALGLPYIPASTLRGVARSYAIRHFMTTAGKTWAEADRHVAQWFGHLEGAGDNRAGKVIFLDAYPTPSKNGGLAMDMANSIWRWEGDQLGSYSPNPNPFFSLKDVEFRVGIRPLKPEYASAAQQVREWLIAGLAQGIGSQVNSGYGFVRNKDVLVLPSGFFELDFTVCGQLVHSLRELNLNNPLQGSRANYKSEAGNGEELRSVAIKNIMRYWFRVFALGVLPNAVVKCTEKTIFGGIDPKARGCLAVYVFEDSKNHCPAPEPNRQGKNRPHGQQKGKLILARSSEPEPSKASDKFEDSLQTLAKELLWLAFHLGGVGQGARRPLYSRNNRANGKPPWWRGSTILPEYSPAFPRPKDFAEEFKHHLQSFYTALKCVSLTPSMSLQTVVQTTANVWAEAADACCQIWVLRAASSSSGKPNPLARPLRPGQAPPTRTIGGAKSTSLSILHGMVHGHLDIYQEYQKKQKSADQEQKRKAYQSLTNAKNLGGHTDQDKPQGAERKATPSPVWIANHGQYEVVTVFGATQDPRRAFVQELKKQGAIQVFPQRLG